MLTCRAIRAGLAGVSVPTVRRAWLRLAVLTRLRLRVLAWLRLTVLTRLRLRVLAWRLAVLARLRLAGIPRRRALRLAAVRVRPRRLASVRVRLRWLASVRVWLRRWPAVRVRLRRPPLWAPRCTWVVLTSWRIGEI